MYQPTELPSRFLDSKLNALATIAVLIKKLGNSSVDITQADLDTVAYVNLHEHWAVAEDKLTLTVTERTPM